MDLKWLMSWIVWAVILVIAAFVVDYLGWFHTFTFPYWYLWLAAVAYALHWMRPIEIEEAH